MVKMRNSISDLQCNLMSTLPNWAYPSEKEELSSIQVSVNEVMLV